MLAASRALPTSSSPRSRSRPRRTAPIDHFGLGLDLRGDVLVAGAPGDDDGGSASGSAYVFRDGGGGYAFEQKLTASDANGNEDFGFSVALGEDLVVIGAPQEDSLGVNSGAAYLYRYAGGSWSEQDKLLPSDLNGGEQLGLDVAVDGDRAILGAPLDDLPTNAGSAYVFGLSPPVPALPLAGRVLVALGLISLLALRRLVAR